LIRVYNILIFLVTLFFLSRCAGGGYSFTQGAPDPNINTVSIQYFTNQAPLAKPTLSNSFTESLKDLLQTQTKLALVSKYGDIQFEGYISGYRNAPVAITGNETAAKNRLTISVKVKYINTQDPEKNFEQSFSRYSEYNSNLDLTAVEDELILEINDQLVQDIFNKAMSNW
jgi:hypothetical protein